MSEPSAKRRKVGDQDGARITDPRFANIQSDPRYRLPGKKQKVKLDKRFTRKLKDEDFTRRAKVDRYGRPVQDDAVQRRLREKFDMEEEDESSDEADDDDEVQRELARVEKKHDPLRDGKLDADSSSDESSTDEDSDSDLEDVEEAELAPSKEDVPEGEVSTRIAIVNLDWDNIRAEDLMAVFSSFVPANGRLLNVTVHPSEFGRERMEREEMEGPPKEIFAANKAADDVTEDSDEDMEDDEDIKASIIKPDDGSEFDSQALRQYQLERLRYFYAVLKFSNKATAKAIYDAVDGTEYLSTANFFDLRFVPEEMDFSEDKPRDQCNHLPSGYKPNDFVTDALQHSKVKLTWDQEDRTRKEAQARAFKGGQKEIDENDLKAYLASDGSDDDEDDANEIIEAETVLSKKERERQKARALLGLASEPVKKSRTSAKDGPVGDIQITFSSGLAGQADDHDEKKRSVFENSPEPQETTVEKYIRKEKERKQKRKEKMKANHADPDAIEETEQQDTPADELGFDDPFFNDEALNDPSIKNKQRKEARLKKRQEREAEEQASAKQRAELELLMAEDENDTAQAVGVTGKGRIVQHFDMTEIEKAEKRKGKKDKFKKKGQKEADAKVLQDDFKMDTADPRFGKLFESHEFAIDPTNQKLRQTKGMQDLIEEGRRRKDKGETVPLTKEDKPRKEKKSKKGEASNSADVKDLVAKLKRKAA